MNDAYRIHPIADVFPMMTEDELRELADDIAANGLLYPIVLDDQGQVIDGRNRLRACELAGVEPQFMRLNGVDPLTYVLSVNIKRRHLSKGQAAMCAVRGHVLARPNASENGAFFRYGDRKALAANLHVGESRLSLASYVFRYGQDLVDSVISGHLALEAAYEEARRRRASQESKEAQMDRLRTEAPDLADLVTEERLTLVGALAELDERNAEWARQQRVATQQLQQLFLLLECGALPVEHRANEWLKALDMRQYTQEFPLTSERIDNAIALLTMIGTALKGRNL